jgi:hypothetical protein
MEVTYKLGVLAADRLRIAGGSISNKVFSAAESKWIALPIGSTDANDGNGIAVNCDANVSEPAGMAT